MRRFIIALLLLVAVVQLTKGGPVRREDEVLNRARSLVAAKTGELEVMNGEQSKRHDEEFIEERDDSDDDSDDDSEDDDSRDESDDDSDDSRDVGERDDSDDDDD